MTDLNQGTIIGRLTRDAELKYTNGGAAIVKFSLAYTRQKKEGDAWKDEANFIRCQWWGKRGESLAQYLTKGKQVAIAYELRQERWEKDGQQRQETVLEITDLQLLASPGDSHRNDQDRQEQPRQQPQQRPPARAHDDDGFDDDIPF